MAEAGTVRQSFLRQAQSCDDLGSPFMARLCRLAAERLDRETAVGQCILSWKGDPTGTRDAVALRLAGCLHALVLSGADRELAGVYPPNAADDDALWTACTGAFRRNEAFILDRLRSAPQTNEVRRSGALLPGFLTIAKLFGKPLMLSEIGASAGLNLQWDRYRYRLGEVLLGTRFEGNVVTGLGKDRHRLTPILWSSNVPAVISIRSIRLPATIVNGFHPISGPTRETVWSAHATHSISPPAPASRSIAPMPSIGSGRVWPNRMPVQSTSSTIRLRGNICPRRCAPKETH